MELCVCFFSFFFFRAHFESCGYKGPFQIAVDATAVIPTVRVNIQEKLMYGLTCGPVPTGPYDYMESTITNNKLASQVYAFVMAPVVEGVDPYTLAVVAQKDKESAETVSQWQTTLTRKGVHSGVHLIGFGADGDSKMRKYWSSCILDNPKPGDDMDGGMMLGHSSPNIENFILPFPDSLHLIKKLRNQVLNMKRLLVLGENCVMLEHLRDMSHSSEKLKVESKLWDTDIYVNDKQNVDAALRFFSDNSR